MNAVQKQMSKIKGNKKLSQMSRSAKRAYARLRESLRRKNSNGTKNHGLWLTSKSSDGTVIFKNKNAKLYGITPAEFALLNKAVKANKKAQVARRAAR